MKYPRKFKGACATLRHALAHTSDLDFSVSLQMALATRPRPSHRDGWAVPHAAREAWMLKVLNAHDDGLHERINERAKLQARLQGYAQDGKVAVEESGRDCDCVEYSGRVTLIEPTLQAFYKLRDGIAEWADGPFSLEIMTPSEADTLTYESRDLALEAYEDGHPHSIVSRFP